ncbi:uncharacterized protein LOC135817676 isoform X1 [Sycon ciliatum]|uniref:uncharacterized protein LOC135817676 isoform X1 n=1 Tax=Sycon ciliatum TaxID=27933 RepID=UPI0031F61C01
MSAKVVDMSNFASAADKDRIEPCAFCGSTDSKSCMVLGNVCGDTACEELSLALCNRVLPCGHRCAGLPGEALCPPCLNSQCYNRIKTCWSGSDSSAELASATQSTASETSVFVCSLCHAGHDMWQASPVIQLYCGHIFHKSCCKARFDKLWGNPVVNPEVFKCPDCEDMFMRYPLFDSRVKDMKEQSEIKKKKVMARLLRKGVDTDAVTDAHSGFSWTEPCRFCRSTGTRSLFAVTSVCNSTVCEQRSLHACAKRLPCGDWCGGFAGEENCLPCLQSQCRKGNQASSSTISSSSRSSSEETSSVSYTADDICAICYTDTLGEAPAIQLRCGHIYHMHCCQDKHAKLWAHLRISYKEFKCPDCEDQLIEHPFFHDMEVLKANYNIEVQKVQERLERRQSLVDTSAVTWTEPCRFCRSTGTRSPFAVTSVCNSTVCEQWSLLACAKRLPCGDLCGGFAGEENCLPCLQSQCRKGNQAPSSTLSSSSGSSSEETSSVLCTADDICAICYTDTLGEAPAIQLRCGHIYHMHCCQDKHAKLRAHPRISYKEFKCPDCENQFIEQKVQERLERRQSLVDTSAVTNPHSGFSWTEPCRFCRSSGTRSPFAVTSVCDSTVCEQWSLHACAKRLPCGDWCGGFAGEENCLPCLKSQCRKDKQASSSTVSSSSGSSSEETSSVPYTADDTCTICYTDTLGEAPAIQLSCGHIYHKHCCDTQLATRWSGPRITFQFLKCTDCEDSFMKHPSLESVLRPMRRLYETVKQKSMLRLEHDRQLNCEAIVNPCSEYYQQPERYAMKHYAYYLCHKCEWPYFGGEAQCADQLAAAEHDPSELVCGSCSNPQGTKVFFWAQFYVVSGTISDDDCQETGETNDEGRGRRTNFFKRDKTVTIGRLEMTSETGSEGHAGRIQKLTFTNFYHRCHQCCTCHQCCCAFPPRCAIMLQD